MKGKQIECELPLGLVGVSNVLTVGLVVAERREQETKISETVELTQAMEHLKRHRQDWAFPSEGGQVPQLSDDFDDAINEGLRVGYGSVESIAVWTNSTSAIGPGVGI